MSAPSLTSEDLRARRQAGYETARPDVLEKVPLGARRILELGCSVGALGAAIKARQEAHVLGVEYDATYAAVARDRLDRVVVADAGAFVEQRPDEAPFDCLICADVLEHLLDPWTVLRTAVMWLSPGATVIVSLPNVLHYAGWLRMVRTQRWPRDAEGIFDATHLRWFARGDVEDLLRSAGVRITDVDARHWDTRRSRRAAIAVLRRTPLHPVLPAQYVVTGTTGV